MDYEVRRLDDGQIEIVLLLGALGEISQKIIEDDSDHPLFGLGPGRGGNTLRMARQRRHESIKAVSDLTGISTGYISILEGGQTKRPGLDKLRALCDHYGLPLNALLLLWGLRPLAEELDAWSAPELPDPDIIFEALLTAEVLRPDGLDSKDLEWIPGPVRRLWLEHLAKLAMAVQNADPNVIRLIQQLDPILKEDTK